MNLVNVIIPAHNEEESVEKVLRDVNNTRQSLIDDFGYDLEILLVLNACTDGTRVKAAETAFLHDIPLTILDEPRKGYGYAHRLGMAEAKGEILLTLDCDNTYPAEEIPHMVELIESGYGFVTTNRLSEDAAMSTTSKVGNYLLTKATTLFAVPGLSDSQSGMWAFRRRHLADLMQGVGNGMELSEQLKIRLCRATNWTEIPIDYYERTGDSKLNPVGDGIRCLWNLVTT